MEHKNNAQDNIFTLDTIFIPCFSYRTFNFFWEIPVLLSEFSDASQIFSRK